MDFSLETQSRDWFEREERKRIGGGRSLSLSLRVMAQYQPREHSSTLCKGMRADLVAVVEEKEKERGRRMSSLGHERRMEQNGSVDLFVVKLMAERFNLWICGQNRPHKRERERSDPNRSAQRTAHKRPTNKERSQLARQVCVLYVSIHSPASSARPTSSSCGDSIGDGGKAFGDKLLSSLARKASTSH